MRRKLVTDEQLSAIVASSTSVREVCRSLGILPQGGNLSYWSKRIKVSGIDRSHFVTPPSRLHIKQPKKSLEATFVIKPPLSNRSPGYILRRALIESGISYVCSECGQTDAWNDKPLVLHVDHIDGNPMDDRKENLRFLCPHCHSQTETWRGKGRTNNKRHCSDCGVVIGKGGKTGKCRIHSQELRPQKSKITWPPIEDLLERLNTNSVVGVAKELGVSDNSVRKHLRRRGASI